MDECTVGYGEESTEQRQTHEPVESHCGPRALTGPAWLTAPTQSSTTLLGVLCLSPHVSLAHGMATWVGEANAVSHECH